LPSPSFRSSYSSYQFKPDGYIAEAIVAGPFIHYKVDSSALTKLTLSTITDLSRGESSKELSGNAGSKGSIKSAYGHNASGSGKSMIIEFSSPNIAKPFHAGHLRSTIIGAFLANLYEANGWYVERWNYLGDWGKQFGLLAVGWDTNGDEAKLLEDPVTHLYEVYVAVNKAAEEDKTIHDKARDYFKRMEDGDPTALALWQKFRDLSIKKYEETYARLNIRFDVYSGESQVKKEYIQNALNQIKASDFVETAENGAVLIDLTKYKLEKTVVERQDGTPLYITRDIGEAKQRWDRFVEQRGQGFDKMIYVVATQQDLHLAQFFKVLELMGHQWAQPSEGRLQHINFGMVLGMSSRKGTAVFLEHILDETKENMHNVMRQNDAKYAQVEDPEKTADVVGQSAVKIQDMAGKRINNYTFDWARMLSFEGDTGPFLQYNHVRLCSVERKNALEGLKLPEQVNPEEMATHLLSEPKARELIMHLASWPDVVRQALRDQQPSTIVSFAFRVTRTVSQAWEFLLVKGQEKELALVRLWLYRCARDVLAAAMELLTLEPLQRM
jgi:arginyl-tRNA synthetase